MNTELHAKKVEILSRLIKESSLTLEEALVLLEENVDNQLDRSSDLTTRWTSSSTTGFTWNPIYNNLVEETPTL